MAQLTLATCHAKEKAPGLMHKTRRELFLERREALIPWKGLEATMSPHDHPQGQQGRPLYDLAVTLRVPCMKLFDNLRRAGLDSRIFIPISDEAARRGVVQPSMNVDPLDHA